MISICSFGSTHPHMYHSFSFPPTPPSMSCNPITFRKHWTHSAATATAQSAVNGKQERVMQCRRLIYLCFILILCHKFMWNLHRTRTVHCPNVIFMSFAYRWWRFNSQSSALAAYRCSMCKRNEMTMAVNRWTDSLVIRAWLTFKSQSSASDSIQFIDFSKCRIFKIN